MAGVEAFDAEHQLKQGRVADGECQIGLGYRGEMSGLILASSLHRSRQTLNPTTTR